MGVAWSVLGAWIVYRWARELWGPGAGLLGLTIWCFEPNILAHAHLVTPDLPSAVAGLLACYVFWHYLRQPTWARAVACGLLLGLAQLTKYTLLVLYFVWPLLWLFFRFARPNDRPPLLRSALQGMSIAGLSLFVINLGYDFRDVARPLGEFQFISRMFAGEPPAGSSRYEHGAHGNRFRGTPLGAVPVPFPADYLLGIDVQRRDFEELGKARPSYLAGEWKAGGWWYYYCYAAAVKVPVGFLCLALWGLALALCRPGDGVSAPNLLALGLPALAVLALVSSQTGFNHHLRYILPAFPFVIIVAARPAHGFRVGHWWRPAAVTGLLLWGVISSLRVYPHSLSYFNELAGGPEGGHRHLLDSNIDWGQDHYYLKEWLDDHPEARPLYMATFSMVEPAILGIDYSLPPPGPAGRSARAGLPPAGLGPVPGYHCLSVNFVQGMPFRAFDGAGRRAGVRHDDYSYFRHFEPVAKAGYSIFIYHLTAEEVNRVRGLYGLPPLPPPAPRAGRR